MTEQQLRLTKQALTIKSHTHLHR